MESFPETQIDPTWPGHNVSSKCKTSSSSDSFNWSVYIFRQQVVCRGIRIKRPSCTLVENSSERKGVDLPQVEGVHRKRALRKSRKGDENVLRIIREGDQVTSDHQRLFISNLVPRAFS